MRARAYIISKYIAFVPYPQIRGMWMKVDPAVVQVECPICMSKKGEPCIGTRANYVTTVCWKRKRAAKDMPITLNSLDVLIGDADAK